eukprot:6177515-Pleurochrysis_carterae.AAC.3
MLTRWAQRARSAYAEAFYGAMRQAPAMVASAASGDHAMVASFVSACWRGRCIELTLPNADLRKNFLFLDLF